jgi:hypothetical protein
LGKLAGNLKIYDEMSEKGDIKKKKWMSPVASSTSTIREMGM